MPRRPRAFELNGIYHLINRGIDGRRLFVKNQDYSRLILGLEFFNRKEPIDLWSLIVSDTKTGTIGGSGLPSDLRQRLEKERRKKSQPLLELMVFTLMPNHYHLIAREIVPGGTSFFMQKLGGYAMYFNKQYGRVGPLFQSRFKAVPITSDEQLLAAFVYVHTNPIGLYEPLWKELKVSDLKMALESLGRYRWTSYHDYVGHPTFPTVTQRDFFLEFLGGAEGCRRVVEEWVAFKAANAELDLSIFE